MMDTFLTRKFCDFMLFVWRKQFGQMSSISTSSERNSNMARQDASLIAKLEAQLYLNLLYAGKMASAVDSETFNAKLSTEEGKLVGALIAMSQTVSQLMIAKGKK
jgi:hypothetical protein